MTKRLLIFFHYVLLSELGCDDAARMRVTAYMNGSYVGTNTKTAANPVHGLWILFAAVSVQWI